jgi:hypothetical protein
MGPLQHDPDPSPVLRELGVRAIGAAVCTARRESIGV